MEIRESHPMYQMAFQQNDLISLYFSCKHKTPNEYNEITQIQYIQINTPEFTIVVEGETHLLLLVIWNIIPLLRSEMG